MIYTYISLSLYIYVCMYVYICIYTYVYKCVHMYVYIYIYIYTHSKLKHMYTTCAGQANLGPARGPVRSLAEIPREARDVYTIYIYIYTCYNLT